MNISVENGDSNGGYFYMNGSTGSIIRNHNYIDYKKKRDEISTNKYIREIMDFQMVYKFMICSLHPHFINMEIWNKIMNIITFRSMLNFQHKKKR